jgi:hypothetical protein
VNDSAAPPAALTPEQTGLLRLVYGAQAAQIIYVAAKLGVPDILKDGPRTSAEIGAAVGVEASTLRRVLRGASSLGVCAEVEADRFALTEMGQYLRSDRPDSLHWRVLFNGEVLLPLWGDFLQTVRSGESGALRVLKMPLYDYLAAHPAVGGLFDQTMASSARYRLEPAVAAYDFSRFQTIVDVGGGNGALLLAILRRYPEPRGLVYDLPPVAERAREHIQAVGLAARCTAVGGDATVGVPAGADCHLLSNFLISMSDDAATTVLRHCREAIAAGGVLVLVEWVMPTSGEAIDPFRFWDTASIDLIMLAINGSAGWRVRTAQEFETLLAEGGFTLRRVVPTVSSVSVIEAVPRADSPPGRAVSAT